jgi:hypothetical protein
MATGGDRSYKSLVATRRFTQAELARLDDSTYREYSRAELSRARTQAATATLSLSVDVLITTVLFLAVVLIILRHSGYLPTGW